jgi:hypothetical protein
VCDAAVRAVAAPDPVGTNGDGEFDHSPGAGWTQRWRRARGAVLSVMERAHR